MKRAAWIRLAVASLCWHVSQPHRAQLQQVLWRGALTVSFYLFTSQIATAQTVVIDVARSGINAGAECPNACSGHGICGPKSVCSCYQNWMSNDCSERICQFGKAHVDVPLGDLDSSGRYTGINHVVVKGSQVYPFGTTEMYPRMKDSMDNLYTETAHDYAECSNKGFCDRSIAECVCLSGYEGSACQRMSCPVFQNLECGGKGMCRTIEELARLTNDNMYKLWDKDVSTACHCDPGFYGPACSHMRCKYGVDTLWLDLAAAPPRYANWSIVIFTDAPGVTISGNFSLTFFDMFGYARTTDQIPYGASCTQVVQSFEKLPNRAVPPGTISCLRWTDYQNIPETDEPIRLDPNPYFGIKYTLAFTGSPGTLQAPEVNLNTFDMKGTLRLHPYENTTKVGAFVYPNGFQGEMANFFPTRCENVMVGLSKFIGKRNRGTYDILTDISAFESRILKKCLGLSDGGKSLPNEMLTLLGETFGWHFGNRYNPHIIKLVDNTSMPMTDHCPGVDNVRGPRTDGKVNQLCTVPTTGFYALIIYDPVNDLFQLINRPSGDYGMTTSFYVYTTEGNLQMVSDSSAVYTDPSNPYSSTIYTGPTQGATAVANYMGNIDCESNPAQINNAMDCLDVNKFVMFFDPSLTNLAYSSNPKYMNMYIVRKISRQWHTVSGATDILLSKGAPTFLRPEIVLDQAISSAWKLNVDQVRAFIFTPPANYYNYVSECSGRGLCDDSFGICNCYLGYSGDNCGKMNARSPENT